MGELGTASAGLQQGHLPNHHPEMARCCLASRHKLKLVNAEHWPERQSLRHSPATARVEERAVGLVQGRAGRAAEF